MNPELKTVPVEPTEAMMEAALTAGFDTPPGSPFRQSARRMIHSAYAAMLTASPPPPVAGDEAKLQKRPVLFRVKDFADGWIYFEDEEKANAEAEATGALMQGLYVRDGSPPPPPADLKAEAVAWLVQGAELVRVYFDHAEACAVAAPFGGAVSPLFLGKKEGSQ